MNKLRIKAKPRRVLQMNSFFRVKQMKDECANFYLNSETEALLLGTHDGGIEEAFPYIEENAKARLESPAANLETPHHLNSMDVLLPLGIRITTLFAAFVLRGQRKPT